MTRACLQAGHTLTTRPKEPIARSEFWPIHPPFVDGQLLPQGEVLEGELAVAAAQGREESEEMEQEDDHRARISWVRADRSTTCSADGVLAKDSTSDRARRTGFDCRLTTPLALPKIPSPAWQTLLRGWFGVPG
jgi:hypothetical protein